MLSLKNAQLSSPHKFFAAAVANTNSRSLTSAIAEFGPPKQSPNALRRANATVDRQPVLISADKVDRVPWVAMKLPNFRVGSNKGEGFDGDLRALSKTSPFLHLFFVCGSCGLRNVKNVPKKALRSGTILPKCSKCEQLHVVSDELGWFPPDTQERDVEQVIAEKLEEVNESDRPADYEILQKKFVCHIV